MSDITVTIDNRARLVTTVLAAGEWPQKEQAQLPHAVHPHAKQTRQFLSEFGDHAAVVAANKALASGVDVDDLFAAALRATWPGFEPVEPLPPTLQDKEWGPALADFYKKTAIAGFWAGHEEAWQEGKNDLTAIFQNSRLPQYLNRLRGQPLVQEPVIMPNPVYPALQPVLAETQTTLYLILPPPKAVGESPPWPYREDPSWVVAQVCRRLATHVLADIMAPLGATRQNLLRYAAVTLCLQEEFDEEESLAYLVRVKKEHNLPQLPTVVDNLRAYLAAPAGRTLLDLEF